MPILWFAAATGALCAVCVVMETAFRSQTLLLFQTMPIALGVGTQLEAD